MANTTNTSGVQAVLTKVQHRQGLRSLGRSTFLWTCVFGGVYAVALIGARLLALWPDWFSPWTVAVVPALGLVAGCIARRRANLKGAARAADGHLGTEDLFLTSLEAERAPGAFQDLVHQSAHAQAAKVQAAEVAPLPFGGRAAQIVIALSILWLAAMYLPPLDPFGAGEQRILLGKQTEQLQKEQQATTKRKKVLEKKALENPNSTEVNEALQEVMKSFRAMQKTTPKRNDSRLKDAQQAVGAKWREARAKNQAQGKPSPKLQSLGRIGDRQKIESWRKDISQGKAESLRRELAELRKALDKIANSSDAAEREKLRKELQERTKDLAEFLKNNASSRQLNESLAKALNQLQAMADPQLAKAAQKALNQTFELSELELKALAQSLRDMKSLEQALKTLQLARKANSKGQKGERGEGEGDQPGQKGEGKGKGKGQGEGEQGLDGEGMPDMESMEEYEEFYRSMLAKGEGDQEGPGMGGPGQGRGGVAPENNEQNNKFKTEKSRSALVAGKNLMTLKTKEVGDTGEVKEEYATQIKQVKQGVGEAILQERVPPGYHDGIRKYFDNLGDDKSKAGAANAQPRGGKASKKPPAKK